MMAKKYTKKHDHVQSCFAHLNPLPFAIRIAFSSLIIDA